MPLTGRTFSELARALDAGETTGRALTEAALEAINDDPRAFVRLNPARARSDADAADASRASGHAASPFAGIPVSVKDLFDIAGEITTAGSPALSEAAPAASDAPVVARLKAAGLVVMGATQMSEFAFTGLGLNPHYPQPPNPVAPGRVPGGSSSGAAVSVALGQAAGAIGTDTGGSVRIPAAFCGLVGFKPTQRRVTRAGAFPLSTTLDSIGPIANSLACCTTLDAIIADAPRAAAPPAKLGDLTFGAPVDIFLDDIDPAVASAFDRALAILCEAGAQVERFRFPELARIAMMNARGSISNAEAFAIHRRLGLLSRRALYDPNVLARIELAHAMSAADYLDLLAARSSLINDADRRCRPFDALVVPTTPILAPRLEDVGESERFARLNQLALRNPAVVNLLDRCAVSLPMAVDGPAPAGLMLIGETHGDARLLAIAAAVEPLVAPPIRGR
jgi:aspartyl-tRNA(Asn)/glutamyl-tRNA(Gln) amidotransferase subunit A